MHQTEWKQPCPFKLGDYGSKGRLHEINFDICGCLRRILLENPVQRMFDRTEYVSMSWVSTLETTVNFPDQIIRSHAMIRYISLVVTAASILTLSGGQAEAQISFGVTQQNGVVMGGGLQVGGFVTPGRTGVRLGVSTGISQLIGIQNFIFQNRSNGAPAGGTNISRRNRQPGADQFVNAAGRFDRDRNRRLDRKELTSVGTAVVKELRQRGRQQQQASSALPAGAGASKSSEASPSAEEMVKSFVTRSMTFDADGDDALDATETKRMATALLRSLS
jgi:hypothetical protein